MLSNGDYLIVLQYILEKTKQHTRNEDCELCGKPKSNQYAHANDVDQIVLSKNALIDLVTDIHYTGLLEGKMEDNFYYQLAKKKDEFDILNELRKLSRE